MIRGISRVERRLSFPVVLSHVHETPSLYK